ncbi:O-antigen ligase family protein [Alphaproteobacteria bacterium]|nr:O-antigen ligase family protein [Alphaproteobacteria bacterium]
MLLKISEKIFLENQNWLKNSSLNLFGIYFFTAGIYQIPSFEIDLGTALLVKRAIFLVALVLMTACVSWHSFVVKKILKIFATWLLFLILNFFVHGNFTEVAFKVLQSTSVLIIVCFFMQNLCYAKQFFENSNFFFPIFVFFVVLIILSFPFSEDVNSSVEKGFGGNRVNFSIWLSQCTVLFSVFWYFGKLPLFKNSNRNILCYVIYIFPIVLLQIASGGRLGILTSLIVIAVTVFYKFKSRFVILFSIMTASTSILYLFYFFSTLGADYGGSKHLFRGVAEFVKIRDLSQSNTDFYFNFLDFVVSYRLTLFVEGLRAFDLKMFLLGVGFGNFLVQNFEGYLQQVHNVFLNSLGEVGIFGFLLLCFIILFPFFTLPKSENTKIIKVGLGVWFIQGFFQPEFFYSQIGSSICYWVIFACALRSIFKVSEKDYKF